MIQHVTLEIPAARAQECVDFWAALGFVEVDPPGVLGERSRWVERRGTQIHLQWVEDPVIPPSGHVAVVAEDFDATIAALQALGAAIDRREAHWGAARAFATDPAGHRVELMAAPP